MKKALFLILPLAVILLIFNSCNVATTNSSNESATNKVIAITTTSEKDSKTSSVATETENVVETTLSVPETQSKIETTVESVNEKKLNLDLLSDIGATYEEIKAKRGEQLWVFVKSGGVLYGFKDGYGGYGWGLEDLNYGRELLSGESFPLPWSDENGYLINEESPLPKGEINCNIIWYIQAKDLFLGLEQSATTSEVEENYNVNHDQDGWDGHENTYFSYFICDDKYIVIETEKTGVITPNSYLRIGLL